jgi:hypothetical protein
MSFPMADAFTRVFPELVRLLLPQGVIDLDSITPLNDVVLVGTTVKVLVRNDLHPQIVQVLLQAMVEAHAKLKALEASFDINANAISLPETKIEIERIEDAVSHIRFPLTFTDQLYNLRSHIDIVRRKIASRANTPGSMAAE